MPAMPPFASAPLCEHMFALLRHDWVWDFFFDSKDVELDMLQCAFTKETLLTMELDISTVEHMDTTSKLFNLSERHKCLFLPSFTTGAVTVGFAVSRVSQQSKTLISNDIYLGRLARDDDNGNCLFISEQYNDNCTEVSYFSMLTNSCRENRFTLFRSALFREIVRQLRGNAFQYDEQRLIGALVFSYHSFDARPCPTCDAQPSVSCNCRLQIKRKRHPRDEERELSNMVSFTGGFKGMACVQVYDAGVPMFTGNFLSTCNIRPTCDGGLQRKLGLWAIRQAACSQSVNPLALMMSTCASKKVSTSDTLLLASLADSVSDTTTRHTDIMSDQNANSSLVPAVLNSGSDESHSMTQPSVMGTGKMVMFEDNGPTLSQLDECEEKLVESEEIIVPASLLPTKNEENRQFGLQEAQQPGVAETFASALDAMRTDFNLQRPLLLAPAVATQLPTATAADADAGEDPELAMRKRRAELRRERNRESAQRSNLKRKLRMQKLKDEIAEMSSREMYLRAREKILREENASLKMALTR